MNVFSHILLRLNALKLKKTDSHEVGYLGFQNVESTNFLVVLSNLLLQFHVDNFVVAAVMFSRGNAGERGGTPSFHLFYQGNGVPLAKIKHGGTPFPLAGIKYE